MPCVDERAHRWPPRRGRSILTTAAFRRTPFDRRRSSPDESVMPVPDARARCSRCCALGRRGRAPPSVTPIQGPMHSDSFRATSGAPACGLRAQMATRLRRGATLALPWDGGTQRTCGRCCRADRAPPKLARSRFYTPRATFKEDHPTPLHLDPLPAKKRDKGLR